MLNPYYQDESVTLYHGDCREILSALPMPDLIVTDPPYIVGAKGCGLAGDRAYLQEITARDLDRGFDLEILRPYPNWFCFCGKQQLFDFASLLRDRSWMLLTWGKPNPTPLVNNNYLPDTEYIFHTWSAGRLFGEYRDKSRFIIWKGEQNSYSNPNVKPLPIVAKCIRLGSQEGNLIIDPFSGSGSTLRAAKRLNRRAIGIEINERDCAEAAESLSQRSLFSIQETSATNGANDPSQDRQASLL